MPSTAPLQDRERETVSRERADDSAACPALVGSSSWSSCLAVGLTFGLRNVHIDDRSDNLVSVSLPLNVCKTSVGDSSDTPVELAGDDPSRPVAKDDSTKLAFY